MKKCIFPLLLLLLSYTSTQAQNQDSSGKSKVDTNSYALYRERISEPPYGLDKVKAFLAEKEVPYDSPSKEKKMLEWQKRYQQLSLREKFTAITIYKNQHFQICSHMGIYIGDEHKIFAQLLPSFSWGSIRSVLSSKFWKPYRDSVIFYLNDCISKDKRIGVNFKEVIVAINAVEMIPFITTSYQADSKDHDILTVLMLLMKNNAYRPFLASDLNKILYQDDDASYKSSVDWTPENEALIIKLANDFYDGLGN